MSVIVNLTAATICFLGHCYPALVGHTTPVGQYTMVHRLTDQPGYGGDVIKFYETDTRILAIHRVWLLSPHQRREDRLYNETSEDNTITAGCINIDPNVYDQLVACCLDQPLEIQK